MSLDDVTYAAPFEPQDSWAGGAGEEPDDLDRRPTFGCACENALVVDTTCEGCIEYLKAQDEDFGKERSSDASLGPTVVAATPGDSEDDRPTPPPGEPPPFVPGGGAGDGAVPTTEIPDDRTVCASCGARIPCGCPQRCIVCRRPIDLCICHLQGA